MVVDTAGNVTANTINAVLLLCPKGKRGGRNRAIATGVRRAESRSRSKRGIYEDFNSNKNKRIVLNNDNDDKRRWLERCQKQAKTVINPIVDWNDENIKDYIQSEKIDLNPLYCEGFKRVGLSLIHISRLHTFQIFF